MATVEIEDREVDAVDSLMDEVEIAEVIDIDGDFDNSSESHLNLLIIIRHCNTCSPS